MYTHGNQAQKEERRRFAERLFLQRITEPS
jgi:hypothetical protein